MSNKLTKSNSQTQRVCVFCGGTPLTKEHLLPDWLKKVIYKDPNVNNHKSNKIFVEIDSDKAFITPNQIKRSGHTLSRKLLIVCMTCNNGWMSLLQSQTKPLLSKMILGEDFDLTEQDLIQLTKWLVMTSMVGEFDDLKTKVINPQQLKDFKLNQKIPNGWKVWIGKYEGSATGYNHTSIKFIIEDATSLTRKEHFIQNSNFTLGKLFIYVISSDSDLYLKNYWNIYLNDLQLIYPIPKKGLFLQYKNINMKDLRTINSYNYDKINQMITVIESSGIPFKRFN